jgi:hypothetical protein
LSQLDVGCGGMSEWVSIGELTLLYLPFCGFVGFLNNCAIQLNIL